MSINLRSTRLDSTLQLQPIPFRPAGLTRQTAAATSTSTQLESSHASFSLSTTGKFMLGARVFSACVGACECLSVCLSVRSLSAETGAPKSYGKKQKNIRAQISSWQMAYCRLPAPNCVGSSSIYVILITGKQTTTIYSFCTLKQAVGGRPPQYAPPLSSLCERQSASRRRADRVCRPQRSSRFPRSIRSHGHRCSCLTY